MGDPLKRMQELLPESVQFRREMHRHPELSFMETETTSRIHRVLEATEGIEILPALLNTGIVARIQGKRPGHVILLREDIDALPMQENTDLEFSSEVSTACHSCGHDIHTASLLLLAQTAAYFRELLEGEILLVFQPAEETAAGAKALLAAGFADKIPYPQEIIGFHVEPSLPAGKVGLIKGPANASTDEIRIAVCGEGGHGAHPYRCADPISTAGYLLTQLQTIISRENPAVEPAVLTFGMIQGGSAPNIIPTRVEMIGTLRTFHEEGRHRMWDAITRISKLGSQALRSWAEVEIREGIPPLINDPLIVDRLASSAEAVLGHDSVVWADQPSPGSDDFSCFLKLAPGVQFRMGTANNDPRSALGLHNPENIFDESAIYNAAAVMLQYALTGGTRL